MNRRASGRETKMSKSTVAPAEYRAAGLPGTDEQMSHNSDLLRISAGKPISSRHCEACGTCRRAKWPKSDPHFCTMRCAANSAYQESRMKWCEKHGDWYHEDDGCYDCQRAEE